MKNLVYLVVLAAPIIAPELGRTQTVPTPMPTSLASHVKVSVSQDANGVSYTYTLENRETRPIYQVRLGYKNGNAQFPMRIVDGPPRQIVSTVATATPKGVTLSVTPQDDSAVYAIEWDLFGRKGLAPGMKSSMTITVSRADPIFEICGFVLAPDYNISGTVTSVKMK